MAAANIIKSAEAGAAIADTASAPLAFGNSHPAVEMIVAALEESRYDTGLDLGLLFEISEYWEEVRKRGHYKRGVSSLTHMKVYSHQVPGGMMSNLVSQLEIQNALDRLDEVMEEIRACVLKSAIRRSLRLCRRSLVRRRSSTFSRASAGALFPRK